MKQKIECNVCGKEFDNWVEFVGHFLEKHSDELISKKLVSVIYDEPHLENIVKKFRAKYMVGSVEFMQAPNDTVRVIISSMPINSLEMLDDVVKGFKQFVEDFEGEVESLSFGFGIGGTVVARVRVGVDTWNELTQKL